MAIIRPRSSRGQALVTVDPGSDLKEGAIARKVPRNVDGLCGVDDLLKFFYKYQFHRYCEFIKIIDLDDKTDKGYTAFADVNKEKGAEKYIKTSEAGKLSNSLYKTVFNPLDPNLYSMILMAIGHIAKRSTQNKGLNIYRVICHYNPSDDDDIIFNCLIEMKKPSVKRIKGTTKHGGLTNFGNKQVPAGNINNQK